MEESNRTLTEIICAFVFEACYEDFMKSKCHDNHFDEMLDEHCKQRSTPGATFTETRQQTLRAQTHNVLGAQLGDADPIAANPGAPAAIAPSAKMYNNSHFAPRNDYDRTMDGYFMKGLKSAAVLVPRARAMETEPDY